MTTTEMLNLLMFSQNEIVASKARGIILEGKSIDEEKKYCGSFMKSVLSGNYEEALTRADSYNYFALTGKTRG